MKKALFFILLVFVLLPINNALATRGACSYHDGVNCNYGATYSGKVMCNDGWVNSSVYFSDAEECKVSEPNMCLRPPLTSMTCWDEDGYQRLMTRIESSRSAAGASLYAMGLGGSHEASQEALNKIGQTEIAACRAGIELMEVYKRCVMDNYGYDPTTGKSVPRDYSKNIESCKKSFGEHSTMSESDSNKCKCDSGYSFGKNNICVINETYCDEIYGVNWDFDTKLNRCVDKESYCAASLGDNAQYRDGVCSCAAGYKVGPDWKCVSLETKKINRDTYRFAQLGSCNLTSDQTQKSVCVDYQLHPNQYKWEIVEPAAATEAPKPIIKQEIVAKSAATKTLQEKPKETTETKPSPKVIRAEQVNPPQKMSLSKATSSQKVATTTIKKVIKKKTSVWDKIKGFFMW